MSSVMHSLGESYVITYQSFLMLGYNTAANSLSQKISLISIFFGGMILYWLWEAMLISYFAFPSKALPFYSLDEFLTKSDQKVSFFIRIVKRMNYQCNH